MASYVSPTPTAALPTPSPEPVHRRHGERPLRLRPTPTAALPTPSPEPVHRRHGERPLRLRVRKMERVFLDAVAAGTKRYEVTQTRYLGSAHGWTLGWNLRDEVEGELWIGLSPIGRQEHGAFVVTHYACLEACDVLDGVSCWADVARLAGSGVSASAAAARDRHPKTALDPTRPTFAWRFRRGSVHTLRDPVPIDAFCGPWSEAALRNVDTADMPWPMFEKMTLSLVPSRISSKRAAAQQPQRQFQFEEDDENEEDEEDGPPPPPPPPPLRRASTKRASPWDHERTVLALSLHQALREAEAEEEEAEDGGSTTDTDDDVTQLPPCVVVATPAAALRGVLRGSRCEPVLFNGFPVDGLGTIVTHLHCDPTRYGVTTAADTTVSCGVATFREALASESRYLQWGLSARDPAAHPVAKALRLRASGGASGGGGGSNSDLDVLSEGFHEFFAVMHDCVTELDQSLRLTDAPLWANGQFRAITRTHCDDYLNFIVVLQGRKTFYLAPPHAIQIQRDAGASGRQQEATDVIPANCDEGHEPLDYAERRRQRTYAAHTQRFTKVSISAGQMLLLPRNYWHYVVSEPETVMINFWYQPKDKHDDNDASTEDDEVEVDEARDADDSDACDPEFKQFIEEEAHDGGKDDVASSSSHDEEPNSSDLEFINDDTEESNYDCSSEADDASSEDDEAAAACDFHTPPLGTDYRRRGVYYRDACFA